MRQHQIAASFWRPHGHSCPPRDQRFQPQTIGLAPVVADFEAWPQAHTAPFKRAISKPDSQSDKRARLPLVITVQLVFLPSALYC